MTTLKQQKLRTCSTVSALFAVQRGLRSTVTSDNGLGSFDDTTATFKAHHLWKHTTFVSEPLVESGSKRVRSHSLEYPTAKYEVEEHLEPRTVLSGGTPVNDVGDGYIVKRRTVLKSSTKRISERRGFAYVVVVSVNKFAGL